MTVKCNLEMEKNIFQNYLSKAYQVPLQSYPQGSACDNCIQLKNMRTLPVNLKPIPIFSKLLHICKRLSFLQVAHLCSSYIYIVYVAHIYKLETDESSPPV